MSTTTTNFGMTKDAKTDYYNIDTTNNNLDKIDAALGNTAKFETAGGTATAITLTGVNLADGNSKTFIVGADNKGAATTINGKSLYKPGTTSAPNLMARKAYTVWYDASSDCFFIKASAEGNAIADQVLAGKLFSNDDDTSIAGTMPNKNSDNYLADDVYAGAGIILFKPQPGYYNPLGVSSVPSQLTGWVKATDPDFVPQNFLACTNVFGLQGRCTPIVTNLVKNSTFEEGDNCWRFDYAIGSYVIENNEARFTASSRWGGPYQRGLSLIANHTYYLRAYVYGDDKAQLYFSDNVNFTLPIDHSSTVQYEWLSGIYTPSVVNSDILNSWVGVRSTATSGWTEVKVKYFMLIDLTASFRAGKEPTKTQMDTLLLNDWYDNDLSLLTVDGDITAKDVFIGQVGYSQGKRILGTLAPKVPNMIKNGDFSKGTNMWVTYGGNATVSANVLTMTLSGSESYGITQQDVGYGSISGHKYFVYAAMLVTNSVCQAIRMCVKGSISGSLDLGVNVYSPTANQWYSVSSVTEINVQGNMQFYLLESYADAATAKDKVMQASAIMCIDLTAIFGAGKEPTKDQMYSVLASTGWWDSDLPQLTADGTVTSSSILANEIAYSKGAQHIGTLTPKVPNLIINGNFANGGNGWTSWQAGTPTYNNNEVVFTATQAGGCIEQHLGYALASGHKYYMRAYVWGDANATVYISDSLTLSANTHHGSFVQYEWLSFVYTVSSCNTNIFFGVSNEATSGWIQMGAKNLMMIDLTASFGAGNEPTKSQMDTIITALGGWYDSDLSTLTAQGTLSSESMVVGQIGYSQGHRVSGTMPNYYGTNQPAYAMWHDGTTLYFSVKNEGFYGGVGNSGIYYTEPNFDSANFLNTANVFGLQGNILNVRYTPNSPSYTQDAVTTGRLEAAYHVPGNITTQPGGLFFAPQAGYYDGIDSYTYCIDPNYKPENILSGKSIFGLTGTATRVSILTGIPRPWTYKNFKRNSYDVVDSLNYIEIGGLIAKPKYILVVQDEPNVGGWPWCVSTYAENLETPGKGCITTPYSSNGTTPIMYTYDTNEHSTTDAYVTSSGFLIPVYVSSANDVYKAIIVY